MEKYFASTLAVLLVLIVLAFPANAQKDCSAKLSYAKELFNSGQIEEIPSLLDSCLQKGFTKEEKIQATLLLIQVYLFDSNREKAEQFMVYFLQNFPNYEVQSTDPIEFVELYKSFKVKPTWGLGVTVGCNLPQVSVLQHFSTENLNHLDSKYSPDGIGFDAGLHLNRYFHSNFWLSLDIRYAMVNFKRKDMLGKNSEELNYSEKTGWLSMPLYLNLSFGKGRLSPYFYAGGDFSYLLVDKSYILRRNLVDNTIPDIVQKSTDIRKNREFLNIWALGGMGLQYKVMGGYFNIAFGYSYCLMPYVKGKNRCSDSNMLYYYQYMDDDFKVNRISCSVGYTKHFYRIKKKKTDNAEAN